MRNFALLSDAHFLSLFYKYSFGVETWPDSKQYALIIIFDDLSDGLIQFS